MSPNLPDHPRYHVTEKGRVYDVVKKREIARTTKGPGSYVYVSIDGRSHPLARIVARAYIPNPENKPEVNHIDADKLNNHVSNLEWCTRQENVDHWMALRRKRLGILPPDTRGPGKKYCPVCEKIKDTKDFARHKSRADGCSGYCKECLKQRTKAWRESS